MTRDDRIERAAGAYREQRGDGSIADSPDWHDLDEADRRAAHDRASTLRRLEAAIEPDGLSTSMRAVMRRITG